jgi:hypothetical protein
MEQSSSAFESLMDADLLQELMQAASNLFFERLARGASLSVGHPVPESYAGEDQSAPQSDEASEERGDEPLPTPPIPINGAFDSPQHDNQEQYITPLPQDQGSPSTLGNTDIETLVVGQPASTLGEELTIAPGSPLQATFEIPDELWKIPDPNELGIQFNVEKAYVDLTWEHGGALWGQS